MTGHRGVIAVLLAGLLFSVQAHAYLDPGTGSAILQGLLAAFAALAVTAKLYWHRLLRLLGLGGKKRDSAPDSAASDQAGKSAPEGPRQDTSADAGQESPRPDGEP